MFMINFKFFESFDIFAFFSSYSSLFLVKDFGCTQPIDRYSFSDNHKGVDFNIQVFENDLSALFPECFCITCALFLTVYGVIITTSQKHNYPIAFIAILRLTVYTLFFTVLLIVNSSFKSGVFLYHSFIFDDAGNFFKIAICLGAIATLCISLESLKRENVYSFEYCLCCLLATSSMLFLVSAGDLIVMYLAIELQSLCFYVLAAFKRDSEFSTEAGLKYFLLGAFSSGILLFGCSSVYGFTGLVTFSEHAQLFSIDLFSPEKQSFWENFLNNNNIVSSVLYNQSNQNIIYETSFYEYTNRDFGETHPKSLSKSLKGCELGMLFIQVGLLFKLSAVPFHMWQVDVYEGSPTAVTAFFAIVNKASFIHILFRLLYIAFYDLYIFWGYILLSCAICSVLYGSFAGLAEQRIKRLLAYSAISHVGYLLISLSCDTLVGVVATYIYMVVYMIVSTSIFFVILIPYRRDVSLEHLKYTSDLAYLSKSNPLLGATLTISMFSLAGIPPLAGFYGKAYLFWAALNSSLYFVAIFGILCSAVSAFYYIRIVKIMYFEAYTYKNVRACGFYKISKESAIFGGFCFIFNICFILYPKPLYLSGLKVALCFL